MTPKSETPIPSPEAGQETSPPTLFDWLLFTLIVAIGGSSFSMIRGAVETISPIAITVIRLWIGAIFMMGVMMHAGRRFPPLFAQNGETRRLSREWKFILAISLIGYVIPFLIFPWAQQYVESGLAGIYMAFMPIWTVVLAFFFAGETLSTKKISGFAIGFIGVIVLIGPSVVDGAKTTYFPAQLGILIATLCYAASAILTRIAPPIRPRAFAASTLLCAAIFSTPAIFFASLNIDEWSTLSIVNTIGLGLLPTGLAGIILITLIQRVGAGFMSLANYLTPLWAVILGAIAFNERLELSALIALVIILTGVATSQHEKKK